MQVVVGSFFGPEQNTEYPSPNAELVCNCSQTAEAAAQIA
jgi:hypothetical protein